MNHIAIDDPGDLRVAAFHGLTDEALRRRREAPGGDLAGIFICEGTLVTERALAAGFTLESVLVAADMLRRVPAIPEVVPVYVGSPDVVETIIGFRFHRGFVAAFVRPPVRDPAELLTTRRLVVGENITNPTNLGTIVRSSAALGIDGLLLDPTSCDPLYRRVTRVSMGAVFSLPHARLPRFPDGLQPVTEAGFCLVGLTPDPSARPLNEVPIADRMALVLGAEGPGLTQGTIERLDVLARIPMRPEADSLNVGAAAAIAAYVIGGWAGVGE